MTGVVPLAEAHDDSIYGSKAVGLGAAAREGLPLPPGVALSGDLVEAVASGADGAIEEVVRAARDLPVPLAVRSSGLSETNVLRGAPVGPDSAACEPPICGAPAGG